jgi:hypothetical protein
VSSLTTRVRAPSGASRTVPSGAVSESTMRGSIRTPSFAIAWYIPASCSGVIDTPCPMGRLPKVVPDHCSGGGRIPPLSPGSSTPVGAPMPKRRW